MICILIEGGKYFKNSSLFSYPSPYNNDNQTAKTNDVLHLIQLNVQGNHLLPFLPERLQLSGPNNLDVFLTAQ
jgi:hypothetical protein